MWENIYKSAVKFTKNEDATSILRSLEHQSAIFFTKYPNIRGGNQRDQLFY
jgi:hypothetical protein